MMKHPFGKSLFILFALLAAAPNSYAKEESGGITDHGGGGSFIWRPESQSYVLWDLYFYNRKIRDQESGDSIQLSLDGMHAGGEWINYRKLKSFGYLEERLRLWKRYVPNLIRLLQETQKKDLPIIAT